MHDSKLATGFGVQATDDGKVMLFIHVEGGPGLHIITEPFVADEMAKGISEEAEKARRSKDALPRPVAQEGAESPVR